MAAATPAIIGFEVPTDLDHPPSVRVVEVSQVFGATWAAQSMFSNRHYDTTLWSRTPGESPVLLGPAMSLDRYLYGELVRCLHGDQSQRLIEGLGNSSLSALRIEAREVA